MLLKSDNLADLAAALAKAQAEIQDPKRTADNPFFKSKFAPLHEVLGVVRPALTKYGLSLTQHPDYLSGIVTVEALLLHSSGQWLSSSMSTPVSKPDAQGIGSATSYLRRYQLLAIAGCAQEDDDGNAASARPGTPQNAREAPRRPKDEPQVDEPPPPPPAPPEAQEEPPHDLWTTEEIQRAALCLADLQEWTSQIPAIPEADVAKILNTARQAIGTVSFDRWNNRLIAAGDRLDKKWVKK